MRAGFLALIFSTLWMVGFAQSESDVRNLMIGDTLLMATDHLPSNRRIATLTSGNYWNFRSLQAPYTRLIYVRPSKVFGLSADYIISETDGIDYFIEDREGELWISAVKIKNNGREFFGVVDGEMPYRIDISEIGDTLTYSGKIIFARAAEARFGDPVSADSVRLMGSWQYQFCKDQTGELDLESGLFEATRYTLIKTVAHSSQALISGRWTPWSFDAESIMPPRLQNGITYSWWNGNVPEPLAYVHADKYGSAKRVAFKASPTANRNKVNHLPSVPDIFVNPNPTFGFVRFELVNLPEDTYRIELYNIIGVKIEDFQVNVNGRLTLPHDFSELKRGTYIYRLVNSSMETIRSKRLVILKP